MSEDNWDVNEEYEKLFGSAKRFNLFDSEEEYEELRQYIVSQPLETYLTKELPFNGIVLPVVERKPGTEDRKKSLICTILASLQNKHKAVQSSQSVIKPVVSDKHLFFIREDGVCDSVGYYDEKVQFFFTCKDSLVSYETDLIYLVNDTEHARETFLKKICVEEKGFYRVVRDAKCRSASAAACYVLGYLADQTCWIDSEGKMLSEVYPDVFSATIQKKEDKVKIKKPSKKTELPLKAKEQPQKKEQKHSEKVQEPQKVEEPKKTTKFAKVGRPPRYYYIIRENMGDRSCNAKGMYDKVNDKFIILEGSELAREVTSSYRYTASDIKRNKFIKLNCNITRYDLILRRDAICNSPDEAACFVLGENSNGWVEWKSKEGVSLESYINKV
jgi:hypothetical protein